jgi:hypothetical protein
VAANAPGVASSRPTLMPKNSRKNAEKQRHYENMLDLNDLWNLLIL